MPGEFGNCLRHGLQGAAHGPTARSLARPVLAFGNRECSSDINGAPVEISEDRVHQRACRGWRKADGRGARSVGSLAALQSPTVSKWADDNSPRPASHSIEKLCFPRDWRDLAKNPGRVVDR